MVDYNKTVDTIQDELLAEIPDKYQKTVGFPMWDILRAVALGFKNLLDLIVTILNWHDIHNLTGDDLTKACAQRRNVNRKLATYSSGDLKILGEFEFLTGDLFESDGGLVFEALENRTSVGGQGTLAVECQTIGASGNVGAGAITKSLKNISGVTSITNETAFTNGYDQESDASLLARYDEDLKLPLTSGNKYHYLKLAKEITGVANARVFPLWNGDNTVKVILINQNYEPADSTLVNTVQAYIDPNANGRGEGQAPCGAYCTVASATALNLTVALTAELESGVTLAIATTNIQAKIKEYLKTIAFDKDYVSYAQVGAVILEADGVKDYSNLTINGGVMNVDIADVQIAVLHTLTVTE